MALWSSGASDQCGVFGDSCFLGVQAGSGESIGRSDLGWHCCADADREGVVSRHHFLTT